MTNLMIYGVYALNPFLRTCGTIFKTTSLVHGAKMTEIISPVQGCLKMAILSSLTFEGNCNASVSQSLHLYSVGGGLGLIWQQQLPRPSLKKIIKNRLSKDSPKVFVTRFTIQAHFKRTPWKISRQEGEPGQRSSWPPSNCRTTNTFAAWEPDLV